MPVDKQTIDSVRKSFGRCVISTGFIDRFYELFLNSHPEIAPKFAKTDFAKQKGLLTQGIMYALQFAEGNPFGKDGIAPIRKSHAKKRLNIEPRFYQFWTDSLIKAVSEKDGNWTHTLEQQWRDTLKFIVDHMISGY